MDLPERPDSSNAPGNGGRTGAGPAGDSPDQRGSLPPSRSPLAVAIGNASLLCVGYVMLGWRRRAAAVGLVTLVLVILLASAIQTVWFELVFLAWWLALVAHGWFLAGGWPRRRRRAGGRTRLVTALALALPVLAAVVLLRLDVARINSDLAGAVRDGDCGKATAALDRRSAAHYLADSPGAASGDATGRVCARLRVAAAQFDDALDGDKSALTQGFSGLSGVLADAPGHERLVEGVLSGFLDRLPVHDACDTETILDGLRARKPTGDMLDRATGVVPRLAPAAIVGCGDSLLASSDWEPARTQYQRLLDQYPGDKLAGKATDGIRKATQQVELAHVRELLGTGSGGGQPAYCTNPAPYSGAAPHGGDGPYRTLLRGDNTYVGQLPAEWLTDDVADAVLVVCAGAKEYGDTVRTCSYETSFGVFGSKDVAFKKIAVPVRVYEVQTGRLVSDLRVQVNGPNCPSTISYTTYGSFDTGPPSEMYVDASDADVTAAVRGALAPVIDP
ncbi:hypothetical protein [Pseudofrankia sp. BMG5.36]|uniref:tetratricopeptide repeat protein n=1 Tax=Pseudofrankia sp. BMG5.36 TaxID=1834512 RepID=UPI0009F38C68|nr:hypothetical protein [Pseudofrankia sp. BMG5.36]